ncbi:phosphoenolpyruvate--protein phosphotransferase [Desulfurispira natronophila]|uniref:Phosphoenolpyruvate-protein phosphotransferase n=1 Tax=Desulfurispira natronophila TaxID=682562 RepID=A0A7W7Y641_9BACT|nr:phosphoenolpyruvate--protein phosphotransferase [Desulfurispira natronophila]MBB5022776.1 phosphotransferase system enzyme I (PtsI) [Desulfurispira natronophila]
MKTSYGLSISSGMARGSLTHLHEEDNRIQSIYISKQDVKTELERFYQACSYARRELEQSAQVLADMLGESQKFIIEPQILILQDSFFNNSICHHIESGPYSLEYATQKFREEVMSSFRSVEDAYLRERMQDIFSVIAIVLKYSRSDTLMTTLDAYRSSELQGSIVYANDIAPSELTLLLANGIVGAVTLETSPLSHTAILCKSLEIPLLTGVERPIQKNSLAILDTYKGTITVDPDAQMLELYEKRQQRFMKYKTQMVSSSFLHSDSDISLYGNVEIAAEAIHLKEYQAKGIGLLRSEFMVLQARSLPGFAEQREFMASILQKAGYISTTIRTLDVGSDKVAEFMDMTSEANPALGLRGIRYSLAHPEEFLIHLKAIVSLCELAPIQIMLPMVSMPWEVVKARQYLHQAIRELQAEGYHVPDSVPLGIMVETPACALGIERFAHLADFFSVGTNDLTQYIMASDRGNKCVGDLCSPYQPPVLELLQRIADASKSMAVPVSVCGETASDIFYLPLLHGMGYRSFSVRTSTIPEIRVVLSGIDSKRSRYLVEQALRCSSAEETIQLCDNFMAEILSAELFEYVMVNRTC